jgi:ABC-type multidrug transport system permease subunit
MSRWPGLSQLFLARLREFYREPEAIFWVYGFPLIMAIGLGIAFSSKKPEPPEVDIQSDGNTYRAQQLADLLKTQKFPVEIHGREQCLKRLITGRTALVVIPTKKGIRYEYDETRSDSVMARYWVDSLVLRSEHHFPEPGTISVEEPGSRYIDFLMPGLMGLNLMGGGLWGIGFVIVDMRVRKLLKRFLATPMRRSDFLLAMLSARMIFMIPEMVFLLLVARLGFGVPINGDPLTLLVLIVVGSAAFAGIGLLIACRAQKTETVSGLMNLVMLPMWLLSGTFFSSKRFPEVSQPFIQALPLTQLNDGLREVMLEGGSIGDVGLRIVILGAWAVVTFALALRWFRWN